jgi:hypothetical protein
MNVQLIKSKVGSIKSGWRCVFMIFTAAADDENEHIVESAFENVEQGNLKNNLCSWHDNCFFPNLYFHSNGFFLDLNFN